MGALLSSSLYFSPPDRSSYSAASLGSPPLMFLHGIPCLWYESKQQDAPLIFYLHCNFTDLGMQRNLCFQMAKRTGCHVLAMEYPGFGIHAGKLNTDNCVRCAFLVYEWALQRSPAVYIMGRSIGTGVLGCLMRVITRPPAGVILHSPFLSMAEVMAEYIGRTLAIRWFWHDMNTELNLSYAPPKRLLIMHGAMDRLFSVWHAHQLYNRIPCLDKSLIVHPNDSHTKVDWPDAFDVIKKWIYSS
jgi:acetyl esterase/lipase